LFGHEHVRTRCLRTRLLDARGAHYIPAFMNCAALLHAACSAALPVQLPLGILHLAFNSPSFCRSSAASPLLYLLPLLLTAARRLAPSHHLPPRCTRTACLCPNFLSRQHFA